MNDLLAGIENKILCAESKCKHLEPWSNYFRLRGEELKTFFSLYDAGNVAAFGDILEIGCGNAFNSAILADYSRTAVATDILSEDTQTHSVGLEKARELLNLIGGDKVKLIPCISEDLPFDNEVFDTVFSFYVLEHVNDKVKSLSEMHRVLKKDGIAINIVPNFVERIFNCIPQYRYMTARALYYIKKRYGRRVDPKGIGKHPADVKNGSDMSVDRFKHIYPHFPFPEPHGNYKSVGEEFMQHLPGKWMNIFMSNGFKIDKVFTTVLLPLGVFDLFGGNASSFVYRSIPRKMHSLGKFAPFKFLGNSLCIVAKKILKGEW